MNGQTKVPSIVIAGLFVLALSARALPAGEASEDILITDPALLESLGFEPDATNVYATEQALREMAMDPQERAAIQERQLAGPEDPPAGGPYGTSFSGYVPVLYTEFFPVQSGADSNYGITSSFRRYCASGHPAYEASLQGLPHGGELQQVDFWFYDNDAEDIDVSVYRVCQPDNVAGVPSATLLGTTSTFGTPGNTKRQLGSTNIPPAPPNPLEGQIDLHSCAYLLRVKLGGCEQASLGIQKARARWRRQVSPAPATATFDDVPTGHPFFQHIEALAASGISSGCDANNFCPNAPLNRGQMAVFLAKALGLHWGFF